MRRFLARAIKAVDETGTPDGETHRTLPQIRSFDTVARQQGLRRLGALSEGPVGWLVRSLYEAWTDGAGTLCLFSAAEGFVFLTRFSDGRCVATWGQKPKYRSTETLDSHVAGSGVPTGLAAHRRRIAGNGTALPLDDMTQALEWMRSLHEHDIPLITLIGQALVPLSMLLFLVTAAWVAIDDPILLLGMAAPLMMYPMLFLQRYFSRKPQSDWIVDEPALALTPRESHKRCPYCHDGIAHDGGVVCTGCFARHHEACWDEHTQCATCTSTERFAGLEQTAGVERDPQPSLKQAA